MQQNNNSRGALLTALLEEKRKGTIQGIIGRLVSFTCAITTLHIYNVIYGIHVK